MSTAPTAVAKPRAPGPLTLSRKPSADPMLENLYTLFRRSYLAARQRGKGNEAYRCAASRGCRGRYSRTKANW
jgi:hypothetical protein